MTAVGLPALSWDDGRSLADEAVEAVATPSFDEVYWPLFLRAFRLAYRIVGNHGDAEDIAAEALARAHLNWARVGPLAYRDAWVLKVAGNLSRSAVRRRRRPSAETPAAVDVATDVTTRIAIEAAVSSLPRRQRQSIVLRYLAGLPYDDIAACLGISAASTRTHVRRGLQALRTQLRGEELDHELD